MHRRQFLKVGALAAALASLPACARGLALGPDDAGLLPHAPGTGPIGPDALDGTFLFATGVENSYPRLPGGRRVDQLAKTDHYERWQEDFAGLQALGVTALRYGPAYYRTNPAPGRYDWSSCDAQMEWLRTSGITVIADLCHFGVPDWLSGFDDPAFPAEHAAYARAFARRYPWVRHYTPVNEISVAAKFSAMFGWWNEARTGEAALARTLLNLARAHERAVDAILAERSDAIIVHTEAADRYVPANEGVQAVSRAAFWNTVRFAALDLTLGRAPSSGLVQFLAKGGATRDDLAWFRRRHGHGRRWLGLDYYATCEQLVHGDGRTEPAPVRAGLAAVATAFHERYRRPLFIAETAAVDAVAPGWLAEQWRETLALRRAGVPVTGFTWYGLTDVVDWRWLLTQDRGDVDPMGLYDLQRGLRPVGRAYQELITEWTPRLAELAPGRLAGDSVHGAA
ncbi:MAG TPA: family 1 glycosylhydrolase [Gemmatimonadales bacterium]|nr:family 1 glycosylhydrolase [Gemmatimonadales bacterium]